MAKDSLDIVETSDYCEREVDVKQSHKLWGELPQVTDSYVVHARGFSVGSDLWLDAYNLYEEHSKHWNELVRHEYDYPELSVDWEDYADSIDEPYLYWSITGTSTLIIQHPHADTFTEDEVQLLYDIVTTLQIPGDVRVVCGVTNDDVESMDVSRL